MEITQGQTELNEGCAAASETRPHGAPLHRLALVLAAATLILSALHFWPFEQSKAWQMASPPNLVAVVWIVLATGYGLWRRRLDTITDWLPHVSVLAFLTICLVSVAFARDTERAVNYGAKSGLMLIGGYALFVAAMSDRKSLSILLDVTTAATIISVGACLVARYALEIDRFGFHDSGYKYGTYVGILAPMCSVYLLEHGGWRRVAGTVLLMAATASYATVGAMAGAVAGVLVFLLVARSRPARALSAAALVLGTAWTLALPPRGAATLRDDLTFVEQQTPDLRQRYIEWQAEINLLAERGATGAGAGSVNEYRSEYYYRLPKLNTLEDFDQNGWLAAPAELGIFGIVCFAWAMFTYFKMAARCLHGTARTAPGNVRTFAVAGLVGLAAASTTNVFSSVHYNGVLIALALVLAMIARTHVLFEASSHANS